MTMTNDDLADLRGAKHILENPGFAAKITGVIGTYIEKGIKSLPPTWSAAINHAARKAIETTLKVAVSTMSPRHSRPAANSFHKVLVTAIGAAGGAFGLPGLSVELPVSTTVMLRSIADIARSHGEDLAAPDTKIACMEVFALGSRSKADDAGQTSYFAVRGALAQSVSEAAKYIAQKGVARQTAPALVKFISQIAERFGVAISEKLVAQGIPVLGAGGGAFINLYPSGQPHLAGSSQLAEDSAMREGAIAWPMEEIETSGVRHTGDGQFGSSGAAD